MLSPGRLLYLNFRFLHRISRWLRHRFSPAGFLIISAIIGGGIFGIDTRASLAYQVFSIAVSILFIAFVSSLVFRARFSFERELPEYGTVDYPLKYRVTISNQDKRPHADIIYLDELSSRFPSFEDFQTSHDPDDRYRNWLDRKVGYPRLMSLVRKSRGASLSWSRVENVPAQDETELDLEFTPLRRGYLHFASSCVARLDPFGLVRAVIKKRNPEKLLILPRTYRVPRISLEGHRKYQQGGLNQASLVGDSQEFMSLRDYQPGDPIRSIHWRSYAKRGEPVVKEFRDEFFVRQGLLLDTFLEDKTEVQFEEAVSLAASFATSVEDQDAMLDLMFVGTESYRFTTGRSFGKTADMLEILACVSPCHDQDFDKLETLISRNLTELSGLVSVLLDWDEKRQEMIRGFLARKIPVIVFVICNEEELPELDPGPLKMTPERFVLLSVQHMQKGLDNMDWQGS